MSYTVLARRYRSRSFDELIGQEPIARTLRNAIEGDRTAHAYLFCGTRGVGKTSLARIFARELNATDDLGEAEAIGDAILRGDDLDVIEIDGASNRGVQEARDLIAGAGLSPTRCRYKIYIIDEVHMLTREAFNALLKTMEEPPAHVKFILCTTDPHKVPATIQSRCQRFDFRAIPTAKIAEQLRTILGHEGVEADDDVVMLVARLGNGSMRDALSLLDRLLASGEKSLTAQLGAEMLGLPDHSLVASVLDAVIAGDARAALEAGADLMGRGATVEQVLEMITEHLRSLLLVTSCGRDSELLELSSDALETAARQAEHFDAAALVHMIALCDSVARNARGSVTARALLDAVLVRLCSVEHLADVARVLGGAPLPTAESVPAKKKRPGEARREERVGTSGEREVGAGVEVKPAAPVARDEPAEVEPPVQHDATVADDQASPLDGEALLAKAVAAAATAHDQARMRHFVLKSFDGTTLELGIDESGAPQGRFLATQAEAVEALVQRATGRRVRVRIEAPAPRRNASADPEAGARFAEAQKNPTVQKAMEIFDAVVVNVEPARRDEPEETTDV